MKLFGIKYPNGGVFHISADKEVAWARFFSEPDPFLRKSSIAEARRAYEAIGYRCVELEANEVARWEKTSE